MFEKFIEKIEENKLNVCGIYILKDGEKLFEKRWTEDTPHLLYSVSKSFVSIAIGLCIDDGILSLELAGSYMCWLRYFPGEIPAILKKKRLK